MMRKLVIFLNKRFSTEMVFAAIVFLMLLLALELIK